MSSGTPCSSEIAGEIASVANGMLRYVERELARAHFSQTIPDDSERFEANADLKPASGEQGGGKNGEKWQEIGNESATGGADLSSVNCDGCTHPIGALRLWQSDGALNAKSVVPFGRAIRWE
jgi:hypothetical protein